MTSLSEARLRQLLPSTLRRMAKKYIRRGGEVYLVGGAVRDALLNRRSSDFDIVVCRIPAVNVMSIAQEYGPVVDIGRHFGNLRLTVHNSTIDISLPRRESKRGAGHRGFAIHTDPNIPIEDDLRRRDFTINAIAIDLSNGKILDPHRGQHDLRRRVLRVVDQQTFVDDPLRIMRCVQFVSRLTLRIDPDSRRLMNGMVSTLRELPSARLVAEWEKMMLPGATPSLGIAAAIRLNIFSAFGIKVHHPSRKTLSAFDKTPRVRLQIRPSIFWTLFAMMLPPEHRREFFARQGVSTKVLTTTTALLEALKVLGNTTDRQRIVTIARRLDPLPLSLLVEFLYVLQPARSRRLARSAKKYGVLSKPPAHGLTGDEIRRAGIAPSASIGEIIAAADAQLDRGVPRSVLRRIIHTSTEPKKILAALKKVSGAKR